MNMQLGGLHCPFTVWRPADGRLFRDGYAFDSETTEIQVERPDLTPDYVIGAACDSNRGVFISRDNLLAFMQAQDGVQCVMHNATFDLRVMDALVKPGFDPYAAVENNLVWDTLILNRLIALATEGHTARGESSLAACARRHLDIDLEKSQKDAQGQTVRTNFGQYLGKPPSTIPLVYLEYLSHDVMATWHLFLALKSRIQDVLQGATGVFGYVNDRWLKYVTAQFGPLTHHTQLRASILMDALRCNGIGVDRVRYSEKADKVKAELAICKERLRSHGYLAGEPGSDKAMQSILSELKRNNRSLQLKRTPTGKWSTTEDDLAELATSDPFFAEYRTYKMSEKLLSTYLKKMGKPRLHPRFGYLLETGRTFCGGGFNLQNLPRENGVNAPADTIRGCFVPGEGNVFIDCDYSQIELVVLGYVCEQQLGIPSNLAKLINAGEDVHRRIAAAVLNKDLADVTKSERDSAKPVSFGRPGGMGADGLCRVAKEGYGIDLTDAQVEARIDAYHRLCPELDRFLDDEIDSGLVIARHLGLTPARFDEAIGRHRSYPRQDDHVPDGFLGGMLLKVLRDQRPRTKKEPSRDYTPEEIGFFWEQAERLQIGLKPNLQAKLKSHEADEKLWHEVRNWAGRRSVFTVTGRLRAKATYCSSRNCLFQGAAADGAILGLWLVWRAGYKIVDFVHDQLVVESPADANVKDRLEHIESLMKQGMAAIIPGMKVQVESVVTCSLNKKDLDRRYDRATKERMTCESLNAQAA